MAQDGSPDPGTVVHDATSERRRPPVMADVARLAGVSQMTVSRAINDSSAVKPETHARVLAAMNRLNYRPNVAARALATGRSRALGVIAFNTTLFGPISTLFAVEEAARQAGYFVCVASVRSLDEAAIVGAVENLRQQNIDGVVVMAPNATAIEALGVIPDDLPTVAVHGGHSGPVHMVAINQESGARRATNHLLSLGHQTVWHIKGPNDWIEAQARATAWRQTLEEAGTEVPAPVEGDWSARSGYELGRRIMEDRSVTAVFAANDRMALGLYRAATEAGRQIPHDLSVVGFDDMPEAAYLAPPLTTVQQDFDAVGATSIRILLEDVEGRMADRGSVQIETELVLRDSTAAPPG